LPEGPDPAGAILKMAGPKGLSSSRRVLGIGLLALMLPLAGCGAAEPEPAKEDAELSKIREQIEAAEKAKADLQTKTETLDRELADIEKRSGRLSQAIGQLEKEIDGRTRRVADLERERVRLRATVDRHRRSMARHARAAYVAGRQDWLKLLMNQEDPSRLARVLAYHSYLNRARGSEMQSLAREMADGERLQQELLAEAEGLRNSRRQLGEQQTELRDAMKSRRELIAALDRGIRDSDAELGRLHQDEQRLEDLLQNIKRDAEERARAVEPEPGPPPVPAGNGRRTCPLSGRVVASFGGAKGHGRWDGVVIEAAEGTPVRAAGSGKVVFADWMRGYGLLTIIDHGDGVLSLYAFNQSLYKGAGDAVAAGEPVAAVGASGGRRQPALYFGIREQGRAVDPLPWCRGPR
jgi:septal ring factor EnvC (AmiA/AmiB activator)